MNQHLAALSLKQHPDKTCIGRIERGFDFLGYRLSRTGIRVADATLKNFFVKAARLYEQEQRSPQGLDLLGQYVRRWLGWAQGGLAKRQKNPALGGAFCKSGCSNLDGLTASHPA
ncbi:MAG: hypothetical protein GY727_16445 [Gammaproteobacteria bacterium]|nr:hypothetical protein [Gammaproteobacteria bacterium]MCP4276746.1 hypothetical protein [Gammaproteobacteria bacterium]MCP4928398.1 hypothetical protein [Gammaproteobacteria bacterium]